MEKNNLKLAFILVFGLIIVSGCNKKKDECESDSDSSECLSSTAPTPTPNPSSHSASLVATDAVLSNSSLLELISSNSEVSLKADSTPLAECNALTGVAQNNGIGWGGSIEMMMTSAMYSPGTAVTISQIGLALERTIPAPSGDMFVEIRSDDGSGLPSSTVLATSASVVASSAPTSNSGTSVTYTDFSFASPVSLSAGSYHIVLKEAGNFSSGSANSVYIGRDESACSAVFSNEAIYWSGSWKGPSFNNWGAPVIKVTKPPYSASSPYATYIVDAGASAEWDLSSFTPVENPNSETGSVTYDIGVADTNAANYSLTDKTSAQIQAASNLTGRYLFIKAKFISDGSQQSTLGTIGVDYIQ